MRAKAGIFVIISLLFLVGTVTALLPDSSTITISDPWVIANGADQTLITVTALNATSVPIKDAIVQFTLDNPIYGTLSNLTATTDNAGNAKSTFRVKTTSGSANITARITSPDGYSATRYMNVNIDHDSPYFPHFSHPLTGTVATEVPFNISITDYWGNPVDNRRGDHMIGLHIHGPSPDDCNFVGDGHDISRPLDPNGNLSVNVKLTTKIGPNNILMDTFGSIPDKLEWIDADTNGIPFSMDQVYSPSGSPPTLPADGARYFTIKFRLFDKYGNPTNGQWIWVNTSVTGEERKFQSNNLGQVSVQYGPRSSIGAIDITATAIANTTVTLSKTVEFMNTGAEIIALTANPDTMASLDALPSRLSDVLATVADHSGNAVAGESVNFSIQNITYDAAYNVTADPVLLSTSNITDANGVAAVQFRPGSFTTLGNSNYSESATGHCDVIASWNGTHKTVPVTWKNYPYLSVKTTVTPLTVEINNTIDVAIEFRGDGWALQPRPIDVVMCTDRSGSMLYNGTDGITDDRMVHAMRAARIFNANMGSNDRVGLVSFGDNSATSGWAELRQGASHQYSGAQWVGKDSTWTNDNDYIATNYPGNPRNYGNSEFASVEQNLSLTRTTVNSSVSNMVPAGGTPMREGLYRSVKLLVDDPRSNAVSAVVLLTDGAWNTGGDPQGGSGTTSFSPIGKGSVLTWAKNNSIRIYTIRLGTEASQAELMAYANQTGGKYYNAPTADQLDDIYEAIAGDLKDNAGVNTTMLVDFENVNVTGVTMPGDQVFDYVYDPIASTKINWQNGTTTVPAINQTDDWIADNKLDFSIGTIKVGQFWNATFRLRVNRSGMIDVFGKNSTISFNGGNETLKLPQTFITVVPELNTTVIGAKTLTLVNLTVTEPGEIKALLPVMWNTTYTGNKTITEQVYYSMNSGPWVLFDTKTHPYPYGSNITATEYANYAQLDVTKLPPGGYKIKVYATASDAPDAVAETDYKTVGGQGKIYLRLE